ncbi:MAG: VWA domain-containing protein [Deltaproteobacteria bacterium]|nr:MAG: VWA domain-containing protein [Deltaproteobacteria bacterium]
MMEQRHQPRKGSSESARRFWRRFGVTLLCMGMAFIPLMTGCNDYPLKRLVVKNYTEITKTESLAAVKAVDILFVIDNSGSMEEEQAKLQRNFEAFINELVSKDINDYQIGVITTDMADPSQGGRLQGKTVKIINGQTMSKAVVIQNFKENVIVGTTGTSYEKALDAMKRALSPEMIGKGKPNEGFLRDGATLAIIFVGDEDDCSNNGSIRENEVSSDVCRIPSDKVLLNDQGDPELGNDGKPQRGQLENLIPVKSYIDFLKGLNRKVVVGGIIGNPLVYKNEKEKVLIDPEGGCQKDIECFNGSVEHRCVYIDPKTTKCGGCSVTENGTKFTVAPGFRLFDIIKEFGGESNWFPICGNDAGFKTALLDFAGLIIQSFDRINLERKPAGDQSVLVQVVNENNEVTSKVEKAPASDTPCTSDNDCSGGGLCAAVSLTGAADKKCHGNGWVLEAALGDAQGAVLRLSGEASKLIEPGYKVKVVYVVKNE